MANGAVGVSRSRVMRAPLACSSSRMIVPTSEPSWPIVPPLSKGCHTVALLMFQPTVYEIATVSGRASHLGSCASSHPAFRCDERYAQGDQGCHQQPWDRRSARANG